LATSAIYCLHIRTMLKEGEVHSGTHICDKFEFKKGGLAGTAALI